MPGAAWTNLTGYMSISACRKFFEDNAGNLKKVDQLVVQEGRFEWEAQSASMHSPGIVGSEVLCRHIQEPLYYNPQKGKLTPDAFNDAFNKGLSTYRMAHTTREDVIECGAKRDAEFRERNPEKPPRTTVALAFFQTDEIRQFRSLGDKQSLGVFDTAEADNLSHADVCALVGGNQERRRAREHLDAIHSLEMLNQK